jgi:hypothetical protein
MGEEPMGPVVRPRQPQANLDQRPGTADRARSACGYEPLLVPTRAGIARGTRCALILGLEVGPSSDSWSGSVRGLPPGSRRASWWRFLSACRSALSSSCRRT